MQKKVQGCSFCLYLVISAVVLFMQATFYWIVYRSQGILEIDDQTLLIYGYLLSPMGTL